MKSAEDFTIAQRKPKNGFKEKYEKKTQAIFNNYRPNDEIKVGEEVIECVQEYIYLRQKI